MHVCIVVHVHVGPTVPFDQTPPHTHLCDWTRGPQAAGAGETNGSSNPSLLPAAGDPGEKNEECADEKRGVSLFTHLKNMEKISEEQKRSELKLIVLEGHSGKMI